MGYRDILRGPQLKTDYDRYMAWLAKSTEEKQTLYRGARKGTRLEYATRPIWVAPFGQSVKNLFVEVKGPEAGGPAPAPTILTLLAGQFAVNAPTGDNDTVLSRSVFPVSKLAKLSLKLRAETATAESKSRITGREYKHHTTNSVSMPFGKNGSTESYSDAVAAIKGKAEYKAFINEKGNGISFIPEG